MSQDLPSEVQQQILIEFKDNPEVFEKIYEFYYEMILKYLAKRTLSAEVAYDLTADTFMRAFESLHKFKWIGVSLKVWLYRIAINALKNQRRHSESSPLEDVPEGHEGLAAYTTRHGALASAAYVKEELQELDQTLFGDDEMAKLSDAMATLKPEHQNVISLYYFSELSQKEIAETTESSESAVKATMHRAMTKLRELLSPNPA